MLGHLQGGCRTFITANGVIEGRGQTFKARVRAGERELMGVGSPPADHL